jgi:hypothetical protein
MAGKEFILYAVGDNALAPLKKQYIGFGDETVLTMIVHLLDSKELHTIASVLLARRAKNNSNSPCGRFSSDKFSRDEEARLET